MRINGGTALARSLAALGISRAFVLHGGHLDAFLVACKDSGIGLTDTRHEATAGYAAAAFARATGGIGVCAVTSGPGFTNALTAMADAYLDAAPTLFISSSPPLREAETNVLQGGIDQVVMAESVTKWSHRVTHVERIPDLVDKAVRIARAGRPGPVYLEFPIDVMFGPLDDTDITLPSAPPLTTRPAPSPEAVERILAVLAAAERPAIIVGGGALFSPDCPSQLATFAERTGIPVCYGAKGNGVLPTGHPNNLGPVGTLAAAAAAGAHQAPDVVVQLGARGGIFLGGRGGAIVPHEAKLIQIDVDGAEIGRLRTPEVAVVADTGEVVAALNRALDVRPLTAPETWIETLRDVRQTVLSRFADVPEMTENGFIHPHAAAKAVLAALDPDTAIMFDGGETPSWIVPLVGSPGPGLFGGNGYLGTLGVGPGYAIGVATARPGRPVAVITGDGAAGFHLSEFDTMARHDLPIVTVIFNNASWGISRHGQELMFGAKNTAVVDLARSAYHVVAQGLGCMGVEVTRVEDIAPAIREAQVSGVPTCINIMTDPEVMHPNVERMVGYSDNEDEIAIPYYENIPLRR